MPPAAFRKRAIFLAPSLLLLSAVAAGCGDSEKSGELIVAIGTDMAMPQQIDNLYVQVQMRGLVVFDSNYAVGSGNQDSMIPATLSLVAGDRRDPVTIRIAGQKRGKWRTYREATTTVPTDRSALIRMPVQWLCDETAKAVTFRDASGVTQIRMLSSCEDGNTCVAGKCRPSLIENTTLGDYAPEEVFGGAKEPEKGQCFDTIPCMAAGKVVQPDADCTVPKPDGDNVNVALRVTNDGICDATNGTICFVPLDQDPIEGWAPVLAGDRLQLPTAVCEKLKTRFVNAVYVSEECPTKRPAIPPCGAWSNVGKPRAGQAGTGGVSGATAGSGGTGVVSYSTASLLTALVRDANTSVCCPLMGDGGNVYTCLCTSKTDATLVSIDVASGRTSVVGSMNPPAERESVRFPAEVMQGALYWASNQEIQRTPIQGTGSIAGEFPVGAAIYERTTMLGGDGSVFALATGFTSMPNAPVQVVALDPSMPVRTLDTGGTQPVFQFAQDDSALYLAVDVDKAVDGGKKRRTSSVIRLAKSDGARTVVIPEQSLEITDTGRGGFTGVQVDGSTLFALYEGMTADDGSVPIQVQKVDLMKPGTASVIYEATIDRKLSLISMIGAVDGGLVLSRLEYAEDDPTGVRSSSVLILPATQPGPVFAADFAKDYPGNDLVSDDTRIYWLNSSGKLYSFPRKALQ